MPSNISVVVGATTVGANYLKHQINQADVGRELIVKIAGTNLTDADLSSPNTKLCHQASKCWQQVDRDQRQRFLLR